MIPCFKINPEWKMEVAFRHDQLAFIAQFLFPVLPKDRFIELKSPLKMMCFGRPQNAPNYQGPRLISLFPL
jgi:hypothetical protein